MKTSPDIVGTLNSFSQRLHVGAGCMYALIFSMFVWNYACGGARLIVSVASCLVFLVFVGPFC